MKRVIGEVDMRKLIPLVVILVVVLAVTLPTSAQTHSPWVLGDVNGDGAADSTDFAIILAADAGLDNARQFCPMNCGDVNLDGLVNSTDAVIVLTYDAGFPVPFPVGQEGCPRFFMPPLACR